jgi:DNA-binding MarR family transcriptional regulator
MATSGAEGHPVPPTGNAFLLAQLGAHAASKFAERVGCLDLTPAHSGVLRLVAQQPGLSQQAIAQRLGVAPSKVVALVDDLQARQLIERRRSTADRRNHALHLTQPGRRTLAEIRTVAIEQEAEMMTALTDAEQRRLTELLRKVAEQQGLSPGVHSGYRQLRDTAADKPAG